ncbi:MAG: hypothetical protein ICV68_08655 [Pyrinomonadaceae bacterium]|nr:hypothetical protein [Pyrinomonadaceae bacterium]
MITGFNSDIVHDGVTYHVQTEDKGLDSPLLLTLVYSGGAILASKRSPYDDLIAQGFNEKTLAERLQRQHKLICAAIRAGRIEELKLMTQREAGTRNAQKAERKETTAEQPTIERETPIVATAEPVSQSAEPTPASQQPVPLIQAEQQPVAEQAAPILPFTPHTPSPQAFRGSPTPIIMRPAPPDDFEFAARAGAEDELHLELMEDRDFHAGDVVALRIRVSRGAGGENGVANAAVTVKILGTTFRPLICSATTDREGMAIVFTTLPRFSSGRAAILIRVLVGSRDAEMRRIILPSR